MLIETASCCWPSKPPALGTKIPAPATQTDLRQSKHIDLIDYELANDADHIAQVRKVAHASGIKLVLSFHNFTGTPTLETMVHKFSMTEQLGADVPIEDLNTVLSIFANIDGGQARFGRTDQVQSATKCSKSSQSWKRILETGR